MTPIIMYVLLSFLIGSISCLFGKKLYFPILMATVFGTVVTVSFTVFDLTLKVGIITVFVGVAAALLAVFFYKLGVFLLGMMLGGAMGLFVVSFLPSFAAPYGWVVAVILMIAAGICAVKWCDFFIMASTSFNGGFMIVLPICFLVVEFRNLKNFIYADGMLATMTNLNQYLNDQFLLEHKIVVFFSAILIALVGLAFQLENNRHRGDQDD